GVGPAPPPPQTPKSATSAAQAAGAVAAEDSSGRKVDDAVADDAVAPSAGEATQALTDVVGAGRPETQAAMVSAAMCAAGHPNPPDAVACQSCSAPLTGVISQVPRPVLAVLTVSTGQTVPVRGDVIVGRAPQAPPGAAAGTQLVAVPSPAHFVSRSHLEITVAGWNLLARDLGSANGTVLVRSGMPPVLLASALPTPLLVGDLLDVGDGVTLCVEPPL
ncbi:FHA domain-containing protein, partial [Actinomyces qiguomingii]